MKVAVYRPKYRDKKTGKLVPSKIWWYEFTLAGKRIRESADTRLKTIAKEAEQDRRRELEKTLAGMPIEKREDRINSVSDLVKTYLERYELDHRDRPNSIIFAKGRLVHVARLLGSARLPDLTEDEVRRYIKTRIREGMSGRTINMELGELSRAIGKPWSILWPKVRKLEERQDVGQALSPEQEKRLLQTAASNKRWAMGSTMIRIALLTGMRIGEITSLSWGQVDMGGRVITVGRAKTTAGSGRQIPMNEDLFNLLADHAEWFNEKFGKPRSGLFLFPFGSPAPSDPTRPTTTLKTVWGSIREEANVDCRLHDLRHTAATKMAEAGTPETTMLALMGHMSRKMLERYSHIRMAAKRTAVESLAAPKLESPKSEEVPKDSPKVTRLSLVKKAVSR
jgi:integrase